MATTSSKVEELKKQRDTAKRTAFNVLDQKKYDPIL